VLSDVYCHVPYSDAIDAETGSVERICVCVCMYVCMYVCIKLWNPLLGFVLGQFNTILLLNTTYVSKIQFNPS